MKWSDIERSKKWETMSADQRAAAREQFFDEFIAPKAPDHFDVDDLRTRWMDQHARGEAAKQPGAEGPRSRGGDRTPMTPPQRLASSANAAVRRGVPVREVEDRLGQAFDERGYFREGEAPTSVTADQQKAWTEARAAKVDPFADMSTRARNPRGGAPMGYVSTQAEIDEATLTPDEIVAKREAEKIEELRKAAEAEGIRSPLGVAKDSLFGNIGAVADTAGAVARLANKKYRVPFGAEISAGAGLLGKLGVESAQDLSDALEAGATPRTQFLEDYARSAGNVGAAMREGQSAERKFAQAELAEAVRQGAGTTAKHAFLNPLDMAEMAGESALLMGTGKLAGTAARKAAGASAEVPGMLASEGAMSAASSSEAARNAIASASAEDLAQFPDYEKLAAKYGADGARTVLAGRAGRDAAFAGAVLQTLTLGATRKLSAVEEIMAGRFVAPGGRIKNTLTAGGREFLQEAPQGAAEALATNIGEASADSRKDVLAGVGPAGIIEGAAGGIIGGGLGALQKPVTPAAKGVKTAEDILKSAGIDRGLVVPPVDGTSDSDLSAMLAANTLRAARDGYAADPDPDRSAAAQRAAEAFGVSVEELNGADSDSGERTGGSVQADRSGAGAVPVSQDSDIGQRGGAVGVAGAELGTAKPVEELTDSAATRRDARRAETLLRAQSGQTVEQVVPQQPQVEIVQEPDSLRSRRDVARAKADFDAYLGEHGVDMAESDRRSAYDGDRVPQPEGEPVAIGPSRIAGKGVLATAPIVKPVTLFDLSADGPVRTDAGRYVNHSPTPNADVKIVQGRIVAVPNREIQAGQELTINYREIDPMREDLATRQHVPLPTAVPVPDFAKEAAADPDKNPEEFGLPKPLKERRLKRTPADFDENYDDALDYLALNGGLNRKAWASEGVDPDMLTRKAGNEWNKRFGLGPTLFPSKGGMTPSEAREKLQGIGFLQPDPESETATIADDDAVQLVMESINQGRKFRLPAGHDVDQRRENILRMADSAAREMEIMRDGEVSPRDIVDANEFDNRERQKPVSAEAIDDEVQPEAEVLRSRIADLELELRTNEITGIPNLRAFNDDAKLGFPVVAAIDMDGLRRLNNTIGHEAADLVLRKLATILDLHKNDGARFYHRSGDEFAARFRDPTEAARIMAELQQNLETVVTRLDGAEQSYDYHGIGISYGLGEDYKHADHNANINKAERLASGAREDSRDSNGTSRRVVPAGVQARRTGDDDGGRSASGDVQYADQAGPVDAQSSGIPAGLDSRKSLATNKLTNRIAKWLGTDFAAEAITLPESLAGALREFGRIFGREVVVFRVTEGRLNANGLRLGDNGALYVNETSQSPALTVAAHELLHEIRQSRPDLYKLIVAEVQKRANLVAWRKEMDARELTSGEHRLTDSELLEELTADGFGDAMTDPEFLTSLAERNPSKFRQFAKLALEFFDRILRKMKLVDLGSSEYLTDIKGLRDAYAQMISDYADGVMPSESDGIVKFQAAWHGTTHKVDRFRLDKIGTGEGAQAYGWGMYFASRREVAESYKKALEKREYDIDDPAGIDASFWMQGVTRQQAIQNVESALANPPRSANAKVIADWKADLAYLKSDKPIPQVTKRSGSLYQVDIPEDSDLLDWDKPLSEQPEKVREAILDVMQVNGVRRGEKVPLRAVIDLWGGIEASERMPEMKMTGQGVYHHLIEQSGSAKAASELLNDAGVPGLRYLDGNSRGNGEGSHNYVIWDESAIGDPVPQFSQGQNGGRVYGMEWPSDEQSRYNIATDALRNEASGVASALDAAGFDVWDISGRGHYVNAYTKDASFQMSIRLLKDHKAVRGGGFDQESGDRMGSPDIDIWFDDQTGVISVEASNEREWNAYDDVDRRHAEAALAAMKERYHGKPITEFAKKPDQPAPPSAGPGRSGDVKFSQPANDITDTPEFKRWFKDSKVVDADGKPLVVYHGTVESFESFSKLKLGMTTGAESAKSAFFFTDHANTAGDYTEIGDGRSARALMQEYERLERIAQRTGKDSDWNRYYDAYQKYEDTVLGDDHSIGNEGANIVPAYLSMRNPLTKDFKGEKYREETYADLIKEAKRASKDGVIFKNTIDPGNPNNEDVVTVYGVFQPTQIKSVNNRGTFDPNDPRILFSQPPAADVTDARVAELRQQARAIAKAVEIAESDIADAAKHNEKIMRARQVAADKIAQWTKSDDMAAAVRDAKEYEAALARQATDPDASQQSRRDALRARDEAVAELATLRESLAEAKKAGEDAIRMQDRFSGAKAIDATAMAEYRAKLIEAADLAATAYEQAARIMQKRRDRAKTLRDKIKEAEDKRAAVGTATGAQQPITFSYADKFTDDIRGNLRKLRELAQDKMLSALLVQNDIEAARGALSDSVNVYRRENLMHGRSGDQLEQLKRKHVAPLVKAMKAAKVDDATMEDWLEATFAPERNALIAAKNPAMPDGGSGMTNAEAAAFLAGKTDGYRSGVKLTPEMTKALQSLAPKIAALRTETLTRMVASGEITQDAMDAMQESAPNYVPLRGKDGVEITTGRGVGRGVDVRGKPIKEAHGRGEGNRAENILAELIGDAERSIVQSEKNRVGKTLAKLVLENPNKDLWSIEPVQTEQKTDATGQVYLAVKPNAADQDMIRFMHDGKPYHIKIADKRLREAMKGLGVDKTGVVFRFLGAIQRYFSAVLTRYNPGFIAVNALRDLHFGMTAIIAEHGVKIATKAALNYPVAMRAIWRDERGTGKGTAMDRYAREYTAAGGKTFFAKRDSVEEIAGKLSAEFKGYGKLLRSGQVGLAWNKAISNSAMLKIVNDANDAVENAMRLAAYAALRESGKSVEQSAEYAKNITVNFNRKGQVATAANAIILFYNAAMQGAHRSITLLRNPKVMMAMGGLAGLQAVLAAYAMGADDEDEDGLTAWEKIPPWEKERNLIVPVVGVDAKGKRRIRMVKWPMPYGFNVFSYAGGQLAELAMVKKPDPTKFANNMGSAVVNAFSPVKFIEGMDGFKPHIMKIFDALGANEDDLGMPIRASDDFDRFDKPRAFSGRADTPEAYKSVAKALNAVGGGDEVTPPKVFKGLLDWAPEDLEFLTGQLTGGTGRFFADTYKVGEKLFAGVDTTPTDYPILRSLVGEVDQNRATQGIYYDRAEKIEREVERVRRVLYDGRERVGGRYKLDMAAKKKADELLRSTPELDGFKITRLRNGSYLDKSGSVEIKKARGLAKSYKVAQKEIDEIRAEIRAAQARTYPSLKEKLAEIRALQEKREAAQRKFSVSFAKRVQ